MEWAEKNWGHFRPRRSTPQIGKQIITFCSLINHNNLMPFILNLWNIRRRAKKLLEEGCDGKQILQEILAYQATGVETQKSELYTSHTHDSLNFKLFSFHLAVNEWRAIMLKGNCFFRRVSGNAKWHVLIKNIC